MEAAFPQHEIESYLRMIHEVLHAQPTYYTTAWEESGLPMNMFKILMSVPEPTHAKWAVLATCARLFIQLLEVCAYS